MKKYILLLLPLLAIIVGVVAAFGTGGTDAPPEPVVLGEEDLMEQVEIWRNQYRRMTPGDGPLVQDVGELPAAWEEFGNRWSSAPAERDLATWLVPFSAERQGDTTVIRDADGTVLWSGTTDFAKPGSTNVTITGALVDEADWPFYDAARWEVFRRLHEMDEMHGGMRGTNGPYTNGLRFTNIWMETNGNCRLGLAWESNGVVEVFCRAMHTETWTNTVVYTNDENQVVTNEFTHWRQLDTFHGIPDDWVLLGTTTITNGSGIFTDTHHVPDYDRVKFYAAAALADFDDDGLSDGQEWLGGTSATNGDTDNDGLSDYDERNVYLTDPNKADTDEDGITDGAEVLRELDPLDRDSDHDGLFDGAEDVWQTNPKNPDSDHDGLPDGWEVDNGLVPTNATGANGADGDPDNDGFPNYLEFLLGGGAMNPAWSGEQLAYRLCHLQNGDTQPGLRVDIEDALNCGGANDTRQNVADSLNVPALMECGYYINLAVEGKVEDQNSGYDKVSFEAAADTEFFEGNNNLNRCTMATKCATNQVLIMANSQVRLRYDTVGHMYHTGAYAKVVDATVAAPYAVAVSGPKFLRIGNTAAFTASGGAGGPFSWSVVGNAAIIGQNGLLQAVTNGVATVMATDSTGGCTGTKDIVVGRISIDNVFSGQLPGKECNALSAPHPMIMGTRPDNLGYISVAASVHPSDCPCPALVGVRHEDDILKCARIIQPRTSLHFSPAGGRELYDVVGGFDLDGDGRLQDGEIMVWTTSDFRLLRQFDYSWSSFVLSGGETFSWGIASQLLDAFLDDTIPAVATSSSTTISATELTHPVGAFWTEECTVSTRQYLYSADTKLAKDVAKDSHVVAAVEANLANHAEEVEGWFAMHQDASHEFGPWSWSANGLDFDGLGLQFAFGHVNASGTVSVTVTRNGLSVTRAVYSGAFTDIYDFAYDGPYPSEHAATLQAGYPTLGTGGRVFKVRVQFERDTTDFDYDFE